MKIHFIVVPPGGGEAEYSFFIDAPAAPAAGDYISHEGPAGKFSSFVVKRVWWSVKSAPDERTIIESGTERWGSVTQVAVECYPAEGLGFDSAEHKNLVENFRARGLDVPKFDASMY